MIEFHMNFNTTHVLVPRETASCNGGWRKSLLYWNLIVINWNFQWGFSDHISTISNVDRAKTWKQLRNPMLQMEAVSTAVEKLHSIDNASKEKHRKVVTPG